MNTILVTGDSRGLGLAIVRQILESTNFNVVGISRTSSPECENILEKFKHRYHRYLHDLSDVKGLKELYLIKLKQHGPFIGYVNNAAVAYDDIITNLKIESLEKMFNVNVFSSMHLTKLMIRDMLLNKLAGSIVHISSISAHTGYKGLSMYAASKGALEAFSKNTAREWGALSIRSNCVCPGFMETEMSSSLSPEVKERIYQRTSLKSATDIESVASTVVFLMTDKAKSITGQIINVDNGTI